MTKQIPGGSFLWARTVFQSSIWRKHPLVFKLFFWLVGNAVFENGHPHKGHILQRGQFVTTYSGIADALEYIFNNALIKPSVKEIRVILEWLQSEGMITVKPLIGGASPSLGRPPDLTRAYLGLLITIINYDLYQDSQSYKGRGKGRPPFELGQLEKEGEKKINIYRENALQILSYLNEKTGKRYRETSFIESRLKDGGSVDDCRKIIDTKMADTYFQENSKYLAPSTLFRKSHWDQYLNETIAPEVKKSSW